VRKRSQWLYDQPRSLEDLSKAPPLDTILGLQSIFLFRGDTRVFPLFIPDPAVQGRFPILSPGSPSGAIMSLLAQLRTQFQQGKFHEATRILDQLEKQTSTQGALHASLREPLQWMRFRILVQTGDRTGAISYVLDRVRSFLDNPNGQDIEGSLFIFESMLSAILSFEELPSEQRETIWNLRRNLTFQMQGSLSWNQHGNLLEHLLLSQFQEEEGITYLEENGEWGFRMSHPWLEGTQVVLGVFDRNSIRERLMKPFIATQREWKRVYFRLNDDKDSILSENLPHDTLITLKTTTILYDYPAWTMTLYQRDLREVRNESRNKMVLLYSLVGFSLLIIVLGSIFVVKGISRERVLLTMKTNFLSSISHELKTPLTSIRMFSEMMAQGRVQKSEKIIEYSTLIGKEANRLDNLIQAILSYTRMERGRSVFRWDRIDLSDLTLKVIDTLRPLAQSRGLNWVEEIDPELYVQGDHTALYSLVQNLVDNAIKYTPAPGSVILNLKPEDGNVVFSVTDTGVGIAPQEQKNIFNDFYRVGDEMTRSTKGSGLGLAIVKRVAETHRANISVQSRPGKGSTFTVCFKRVHYEQQDSNRRG
jgi:signal transduction histidine kinase